MSQDIFNETFYSDKEDPELQVPGMGVMKLSYVKAQLKEQLKGLVLAYDDNNYELMYDKIFRSQIIKSYLISILQYEQHLKNSAN
jgi:hypothetical protein